MQTPPFTAAEMAGSLVSAGDSPNGENVPVWTIRLALVLAMLLTTLWPVVVAYIIVGNADETGTRGDSAKRR